jgi:hypothetical protein
MLSRHLSSDAIIFPLPRCAVLPTGVVARLSLALALLAALCDAHHGLYFASVTPSSVPAAGVRQDLT